MSQHNGKSLSGRFTTGSRTIMPTLTGRTGNTLAGESRPAARLNDIKKDLHFKLVDRINPTELNQVPADRRRSEITPLIERLLDSEQPYLTMVDRRQLIEDLLDEILGLGPLERLLRDSSISDILVNGPDEVYVERKGKLAQVDLSFRDNDHLLQIIDRIVSRLGRRIDESSPMVDARLPDGSRVNAVIPPLALKGPALSIRRFGANPLKLEDLLQFKAFTEEMAVLLEGAIRARLNVVISGGTGSGKTTLLNTLSRFIPLGERLITIEDAAELQLQRAHVVQLETRPPSIEGKGEVTARDLVRNALRMRPDRIIIGECRGAEALDMLQAMNTGHEGSLTTLHANSPRDALSRLESMVLMTGIELPVKVIRQQLSSAVDLIVQVNRLQGGPRKITSITEVLGMEQDIIIMQDLFRFRQLGIDSTGRAHGQFETTGVRPRFMDRLEAAGVKLPSNLFQERILLRD